MLAARHGLSRRLAAATSRLAAPLASPAASSSAAATSAIFATRSLATHVDQRDTNEGKKRRANFWSKWGEKSQQEFWQEVGFGQDRQKDHQRTGLPGERRRKKKGAPSGEREDFREGKALEADEYFDASDALEDADGGSGFGPMDEYFDDEYLDAEDGAADEPGAGRTSSRAGVERARRAREALMSGRSGVEAGRRAELLTLLEDLGPEGLLPPPKMPEEDVTRNDGSALLKEDLSRSLLTTRSYADAVKLREGGMLPEGGYFAYLLNTRRVAKVSAEGKRISYSCLVVVGNGQGTAGMGMGKDITAGTALYKATCEARKQLVHIDRFDDRTLFHAIDDRFARTKLQVRLRRPGSGTRCSWVIWKILSAFGVTDVSVKCHGSRNPTAVTHAVFNALQRMSSAQSMASRRGLRVLDLDPRDIAVPGY